VVVLADREFERINLDVNLVPTDQRPTDEIQLRDLLGFADIPAPIVPAIPVAQQLAEKFHAYVRSYGNGSSRPRDLYDMLVIAERLPVPPAPAVLGLKPTRRSIASPGVGVISRHGADGSRSTFGPPFRSGSILVPEVALFTQFNYLWYSYLATVLSVRHEAQETTTDPTASHPRSGLST
jgi:hypothetical protein